MKALVEKSLTKLGKFGINRRVLLLLLAVLVVGYWFGGRGKTSDTTVSEQTTSKVEAKDEVWTCSMHPQIRLPKKGLCPICNMELIPASTDQDSSGGMRQLAVSENAKKLMDIIAVPVERKFVNADVRMVGKVEYDETNLAYITAWIPGRLDRLYVDYTGVPVKKGDHMVSLYSPELISAQEELLQAIKTIKNVEDTTLGIMKEMSQSTADAAREKLRLWGLTPEQIDNIEKTGEVSDHMTIYAPAGGIVIHKNALEGMYVKTGTKIYTIADLSKVWIKLDAYESDLQWLRYGQQVKFTTVSFPGEFFKGTISFIDPILNEKTRTVKIRVNVANPEGKLKPGMFVKAVVSSQVAGGGKIMDADLSGKWICPMHPEIIKPTSGICDICQMPLVLTESLGYVSDDPDLVEKPLVIPVSAALMTGTRAIVYVQLPDTDKPTFEGREIVLGPKAGDYYIVRSGLEEGELVVVKGSFKIDSSLQIMAKPSMMTPEGAGGSGTHNHGPKQPEDGTSSEPSVELPALFKFQLESALAKAQRVEKSFESEDISKVRSAFAEVETALKKVGMNELTGHDHMLWMELSMRLTNDAVEGKHAKTFKDARRIADLMTANMESIRTKFGLMQDHVMLSRQSIGDDFRVQLSKVFEGYFKMHQALAADNPQSAIEAVKQIIDLLKEVDVKMLSGNDSELWQKSVIELNSILAKSVKTEEIQSQRENFYLLSQHLAKLAKHFGSTIQKPVYILHCPMAFDNKGADWLQSNDQTRNPYYGEMMLQCGGVKEVVGVKEIWEKKDN